MKLVTNSQEINCKSNKVLSYCLISQQRRRESTLASRLAKHRNNSIEILRINVIKVDSCRVVYSAGTSSVRAISHENRLMGELQGGVGLANPTPIYSGGEWGIVLLHHPACRLEVENYHITGLLRSVGLWVNMRLEDVVSGIAALLNL